jgi:hypothetical protein
MGFAPFAPPRPAIRERPPSTRAERFIALMDTTDLWRDTDAVDWRQSTGTAGLANAFGKALPDSHRRFQFGVRNTFSIGPNLSAAEFETSTARPP